jgi:RNA polymerase primary sigma factor
MSTDTLSYVPPEAEEFKAPDTPEQEVPVDPSQLEGVADPSAEDDFAQVDNAVTLSSMLDRGEQSGKINPRERDITEERFGVIDGDPKSLREVSDKHKISLERARELQTRTIRNLRRKNTQEVDFK